MDVWCWKVKDGQAVLKQVELCLTLQDTALQDRVWTPLSLRIIGNNINLQFGRNRNCLRKEGQPSGSGIFEGSSRNICSLFGSGGAVGCQANCLLAWCHNLIWRPSWRTKWLSSTDCHSFFPGLWPLMWRGNMNFMAMLTTPGTVLKSGRLVLAGNDMTGQVQVKSFYCELYHTV